jgi:hypothetical protein
MSSIFVKEKEIETDVEEYYPKNLHDTFVIYKEDLENSIPDNYLTQENIELQKTHDEYRWQIYKIGDKEYIDITFKKNGHRRAYLTYSNDMIDYKVDKKWEKYIISRKYYYTKEN